MNSWLPLLSRELKVRSQQRNTWWLRSGVLLAGYICCLLPFFFGRSYWINGRSLLLLVSFFPLCISLLSGVFTTADCISREKREGTLGFLLLTRLGSFEIILQKMLACSGTVLMALLAMTPLVMVPGLIGGVTGQEATAVMFLVLGIGFCSSALGCFISTIFSTALSAGMVTFLAMAALAGSQFILDWLAPESLFVLTVEQFSPMWTWYEIVVRGAGAASLFAVMMPFVVGAGAIVGASVCLRVDRYFSLPLRSVFARRVIHVSLALGAAVAFFGLAGSFRIPLLIVISMMVKCWAAIMAVQIFSSKQWLEMVLTTPVAQVEFMRNEILSFGRKVAWPCGLGLVCSFILIAKLKGNEFVFGLQTTMFLLFDCTAIVTAGLWAGLKYAKFNDALTFTMGQIVGLPCLIAFASMTLGLRTKTAIGGLFLWSLLCFAIDLLTGLAAAFALRHQFRSAAAETKSQRILKWSAAQ